MDDQFSLGPVSALCLLAWIVPALLASGCVLRSDRYSPSQRWLQVALAWLLPGIGGLAVLTVWFHDRTTLGRDDGMAECRVPESWMAGSGPVHPPEDSLGGHGHHGVHGVEGHTRGDG